MEESVEERTRAQGVGCGCGGKKYRKKKNSES